MDVLEHEHRRVRRRRELGDQERLDVVRRRAGGEGLLERRRRAPHEVPDRPQGPRNREVVAGADEHPPVRVEVADEAGHERRLADARLACDERGPAPAPRGRVAGVRESRQGSVALEELHASKIDLPRVPAASQIGTGATEVG